MKLKDIQKTKAEQEGLKDGYIIGAKVSAKQWKFLKDKKISPTKMIRGLIDKLMLEAK